MRVTKLILGPAGVLSLVLVGVSVRGEGVSQVQIVPAAATADADASNPVPRPKDPANFVPPAPIPESSTTPAASAELVTERYPNGNVKVERHVTKDANENYVNHGTYTVYGADSKVQMTGEYLFGKQQGRWTQSFAKDDGHLFATDREAEFFGPFASEATFVDGQLNGAWTIKDSKGQNIVEWKFDQGVPDGTWTWWYPTGNKRLEATYKSGRLDGDVLEYDRDGKLAAKETYGGMHLVRTVGWYTLGKKHFEGCYLRAAGMPEPTYDWWKGTVTTSAAKPAGKDLKHGAWVEWYQSGKKKTEAQYDHDVAIGKFVWWYENGQKQAEVSYHQGTLNGTWTTWHPNGLKESQAEYRDGEQVEKWVHWDVDGKVVEIREVNQAPREVPKASHVTSRQTPTPVTRSR